MLIPDGARRGRSSKSQGREFMALLSRREWGLLALALIFQPISFGLCHVAAAQEKTILTFANTGLAEETTREGLKKAVTDFEAANPSIEIHMEAISFSDIGRQMVLRVRSGNPPDIAELDGNDTIMVALTGGLEPLEGLIPPSLMKNIKPANFAGLTVNGKLIAIPWNMATAGLWYDKKILAAAGLDPTKPPRTIPDLIAALKAVKATQPDVIPLGLDTTNRPFALSASWPWIRAFGAVPFGENATGANSPEMKAYLSWMRELAQKHYIDPGRKIGEFRPLAAAGKVAFIWDQVLLQGVIQSVNGMTDQQFNDTWGVVPMPAGPSGKSYTFEAGQQLAIFTASKHKEAATKFIDYLITSPAVIRDYTIKLLSSIPSITDTGDPALDAELNTPVFNAFTHDITPTLTPQPYGPKFAGAAAAIMPGVQEAVTGDQPIDEIAASIQEQLDRL
jgi:multiple sugar transport system substrate-binding protein